MMKMEKIKQQIEEELQRVETRLKTARAALDQSYKKVQQLQDESLRLHQSLQALKGKTAPDSPQMDQPNLPSIVTPAAPAAESGFRLVKDSEGNDILVPDGMPLSLPAKEVATQAIDKKAVSIGGGGFDDPKDLF